MIGDFNEVLLQACPLSKP